MYCRLTFRWKALCEKNCRELQINIDFTAFNFGGPNTKYSIPQITLA